MSNRNYIRGRQFEYRVLYYLRKLGYYCLRSWGSKGVYDILAVKKSDNPNIPFELLEDLVPLSIKKSLLSLVHWFKNPILIQAKSNGYVKPAEREKLQQNQNPNGESLIAYKKDRKLKFRSLNGEDVIIA